MRRTLPIIAVVLLAACSSGVTPTFDRTLPPSTGIIRSPAATLPLGTSVPTSTPIATTVPETPGASPTLVPTDTPVVTPAPTDTAIPTPGATPIESIAPSPTVPASTNLVEVAAGGGATDPDAGGSALDARIQRPTGLAVAPDGTIWIIDSSAGTALRVTSDGLIHVAAGGMYGPQGMCLTPDGRAYIAERGIYRIVTTNGNGGVTAVAGHTLHAGFSGDGGPAKRAYLDQPYDVVSDAAGNLYIADTSNERVRFIDAQTGQISTIAGNGTNGFAGDGGLAVDAELSSPQALAVDPAGTILYIADYGDSHLRRVDLTSGIITTALGSGAGAVAYDPLLTGLQVAPTRLIAVALDSEGNVYVPVFFTDKGQMVMRMDPQGNLSVVAGGGTSSDVGLAATNWRVPSIEVLKIEPTSGALLIGSNDGFIYRIPEVTAPV